MNATAVETQKVFDLSSEDAPLVKIEDRIKIDACAEDVWRVLEKLDGIAAFNPQVKKAFYKSDQRSGIGAARTCEFGGGRQVDEHVVEWIEGQSYTVEIRNGRGVPPFAKAFGTLEVLPADGASEARFVLEYRLKFGVLGKLMDRFMVRPQFSKVVPSVLEGLKQYVEDKKI